MSNPSLKDIVNANVDYELLRKLFMNWQYVKIVCTILLIWYGYYQIKRFDNVQGATTAEIVKNQNKVKFQTRILIGDGHGICAYISMLWSGTIITLMVYFIAKAQKAAKEN